MKLLIAGTLAAGLVFAAAPTFAQTTPATIPTTPGVHVNPDGRGNPDKAQDHAEYHQQWEDCMAREGAKNRGAGKAEGQHEGQHKANGKAVANSKANETTEPKGEGKKENRHQEEMQACREQLYGRAGKAPAAPK